MYLRKKTRVRGHVKDAAAHSPVKRYRVVRYNDSFRRNEAVEPYRWSKGITYNKLNIIIRIISYILYVHFFIESNITDKFDRSIKYPTLLILSRCNVCNNPNLSRRKSIGKIYVCIFF